MGMSEVVTNLIYLYGIKIHSLLAANTRFVVCACVCVCVYANGKSHPFQVAFVWRCVFKKRALECWRDTVASTCLSDWVFCSLSELILVHVNKKKQNRTVNDNGKFIRHSEKISRIYNTDARASSHVTVIFLSFVVLFPQRITIYLYMTNERHCARCTVRHRAIIKYRKTQLITFSFYYFFCLLVETVSNYPAYYPVPSPT